jgi:hypothetical protein
MNVLSVWWTATSRQGCTSLAVLSEYLGDRQRQVVDAAGKSYQSDSGNAKEPCMGANGSLTIRVQRVLGPVAIRLFLLVCPPPQVCPVTARKEIHQPRLRLTG